MFFHPKGDLEHLSIHAGSKGIELKTIQNRYMHDLFFWKSFFSNDPSRRPYYTFKQGAFMPWLCSNRTSQTNRLCIATSELAGFSMHTVPPAQITSNMRMQVLGARQVSLSEKSGKEGTGHGLWQQAYFKIKLCFNSSPSFRERSLLLFRTLTTFSSPSGTKIDRDPVPRFTGTKDEQQTAKIATSISIRDLKTNLIAKTSPALELRSKLLRFPFFFDCLAPYAMSKAMDS